MCPPIFSYKFMGLGWGGLGPPTLNQPVFPSKTLISCPMGQWSHVHLFSRIFLRPDTIIHAALPLHHYIIEGRKSNAIKPHRFTLYLWVFHGGHMLHYLCCSL